MKHIVTMVDSFSRWPEVYPVDCIDASTVSGTLLQWISRFAVPKFTTTDRGRQIESRIFDQLIKYLGAHHIATTSYYPQVNDLGFSSAQIPFGQNLIFPGDLATVIPLANDPAKNVNQLIRAFDYLQAIPTRAIQLTKCTIPSAC